MKIEYRKGDLFKTDVKTIIHGCNDRGVQGSGFALIIKNNFPEAYEVYRKEFETNGLVGGSIIPVETNGKIIINMITQNFYGKDGKRYAKYDWIADGFYQVDLLTNRLGIDTVVMPAIGAGLGGGDWNVISAIIESECKNIQPVVYQL